MLNTERLLLRPFEESDADAVFEYATKVVGDMAGWPAHESVAESLNVIRTIFSSDKVYAVTLKEEARAIGMVALLVGAESNFPIATNEAELAYWIGEPYWGRGLIPEASKKLIEHAFTTLDLQALWCGFYDSNKQSFKAQEKCGFSIVRTEEQQSNRFLNEYRKTHVSYLSKETWLNTVH